jgi:hypothetical protein
MLHMEQDKHDSLSIMYPHGRTCLAPHTLAPCTGPALRRPRPAPRASCRAPRPCLALCAIHALRLAPPFVPCTARRSRLALRSPAARQLAFIGRQVDEHMLQPYMSYVSSGCCKSRSGVAYVAMANVASVCFKCFSCFKHMLQVFLSGCCIYVAMATHVCCKCTFYLFQMYVASVLS